MTQHVSYSQSIDILRYDTYDNDNDMTMTILYSTITYKLK